MLVLRFFLYSCSVLQGVTVPETRPPHEPPQVEVAVSRPAQRRRAAAGLGQRRAARGPRRSVRQRTGLPPGTRQRSRGAVRRVRERAKPQRC